VSLQAQRRSEIEELERRLASTEQQRKAEAEEASRQHAALEEQRGQEAEAARRTIASLERELSQAQGRASELGHLLDGERTELANREATITSLKEKLEEVERQSTSVQEQALRALTKIRNDQALAAKAKKALAIALTMLDEQERSPFEAARD
jgi:hypothetical protein